MARYVLVTGGAGYIGSHTCKALWKCGFTPVVYDNLSTGHAYAVKWGPFVRADLSNESKLAETFALYPPEAVIHFAASALVMESLTDPGKYYRNNISSTLTLLETMRRFGVKKLIFSSSCTIYGTAQSVPIKESHPQKPISPYGKSKWMAEQIIADFASIHGFMPTLLRYFNAAGADLETQIGENHTPETHLIPNAIQTALGLKKEVVVYGTDFGTKDGSAVRDYVHVQDLADAHVAALTAPPCAVNLGTGIGCSVLEIIQAIEQFCGKAIPVRLERRREGEPGILTADNKLAQEWLKWQPRFSDLPTIIESAWKWHQLLFENEHLVRTALKGGG